MKNIIFIIISILLLNIDVFAMTEDEFSHLKNTYPKFDEADQLLIKNWNEAKKLKDDNPDKWNILKSDQIEWIKTGRDQRAKELINSGLDYNKAYTQATNERSNYLLDIINSSSKNNDNSNNINSNNNDDNKNYDEYINIIVGYLIAKHCSNNYTKIDIDQGEEFYKRLNKKYTKNEQTVLRCYDKAKSIYNNIENKINLDSCRKTYNILSDRYKELNLSPVKLFESISSIDSMKYTDKLNKLKNTYLNNRITNECINKFIPKYHKEDYELDGYTISGYSGNDLQRGSAINEFNKIKDNIDLDMCVKTLPITISQIKKPEIASTYKNILTFLKNKLNDNNKKTLPVNEFGLFGFYSGETIDEAINNAIKLNYNFVGVVGVISKELNTVLSKYKDKITIDTDDIDKNYISFIPDFIARNDVISKEINSINDLKLKINKDLINLIVPDQLFKNNDFIINRLVLMTKNKPKIGLHFISNRSNNNEPKLALINIFVEGKDRCNTVLDTMNKRYGEELNDLWVRNDSISTFFKQSDNNCAITFFYPNIAEDLFSYFYNIKIEWYNKEKKKAEEQQIEKQKERNKYMEGM